MSYLLIFILKLFLFELVSTEQPQPFCLQCICEATSNCNQNLKCPMGTGYGEGCGPYQIGRQYWEEGNSIGYNFETCVNLKSCAERVVINYARKYERDCNGDGVIDCLDYAALHQYGAKRCHDSSLYQTEFWLNFQQTKCYNDPSGVFLRNNPRYNKPYRSRNLYKPPKPLKPIKPIKPVRSRIESLQPPRVDSRSTYEVGNRNFNRPNTRVTYPTQPRTPNRVPFNPPPAITPVTSIRRRPQPYRTTTRSRPRPTPVVSNEIDFDNHVSQPQPPYREDSFVNPKPPARRPLPVRTDYQPISRPVDRTDDYNTRGFNENENEAIPEVPNRDRNNNVNRGRPNIEIIFPGRDNDNLPVRPPSIPTSTRFGGGNSSLVTNECLECLCEATDSCDITSDCPNDNYGCGPFRLSYNYWLRGGGLGEYANCASNFDCARETVRRYLSKHPYDCNEDQVVDCLDFAVLHKNGPNQCKDGFSNVFNSNYWNNFEDCYGFEKRKKKK